MPLTSIRAEGMLRRVSQYPLFGLEPQVFSVSELNRYLRQVFEADYRLQDVWVSGEVSNFSRPASGHLYFTLRDAQASLRCVMWRPEVLRQRTLPRDGDRVEAHGRISVYEAGGVYQLYCDALRPVGEGVLFQEFLRLKARLESEGLFDPARKRPLPAWPKRIGLVTSPSGAAIRDVLTVLRRRYPLAEVVLAPTAVQGAEAAPSIVAALAALNEVGRPDVILLVRGGGSIEDLWAFNDERVARAVAASRAPVVTGIGHQTDVHIADFVADLHASTPSAAAELATPNREQLRLDLYEAHRSLSASAAALLRRLSDDVDQVRIALRRASPQAKVANARQALDDLALRMLSAVRHDLALRTAAVAGMGQTLHAVSPLAVLARGYAVVTREVDGVVVRSVRLVSEGDRVSVRVADGVFPSQVGSIRETARS